MKITIQNSAGGNKSFRNLASLARRLGEGAPFGGYACVEAKGIGVDEVSHLLAWGESQAREFALDHGRRPKKCGRVGKRRSRRNRLWPGCGRAEM